MSLDYASSGLFFPSSPRQSPSCPSCCQRYAGVWNLVADEVVVKQEIAHAACIDSVQGISLDKDLLPFTARTLPEDAHRMLSIVDLDTYH